MTATDNDSGLIGFLIALAILAGLLVLLLRYRGRRAPVTPVLPAKIAVDWARKSGETIYTGAAKPPMTDEEARAKGLK